MSGGRQRQVFTIEKEFGPFCAAHRLTGLPDEHPCTSLHGHNYRIRVRLQSTELNPVGFVRDYHDLDRLKQWLTDKMDHRDLELLTQAGLAQFHCREYCAGNSWVRLHAVPRCNRDRRQ